MNYPRSLIGSRVHDFDHAMEPLSASPGWLESLGLPARYEGPRDPMLIYKPSAPAPCPTPKFSYKPVPLRDIAILLEEFDRGFLSHAFEVREREGLRLLMMEFEPEPDPNAATYTNYLPSNPITSGFDGWTTVQDAMECIVAIIERDFSPTNVRTPLGYYTNGTLKIDFKAAEDGLFVISTSEEKEL